MGITVKRTGDEGQNFTQTSQGDTPNNITVSTNAKGHAQLEIKLCFGSPAELAELAPVQMALIIARVRESLAQQGIPLAGK